MKIGMIFAAAAACAWRRRRRCRPSRYPRHRHALPAALGHQVMLLQWLANQERAATAAGVPASQLYVHQNGDAWDYLLIAPDLTDAQDDAVEAAAKKPGHPDRPESDRSPQACRPAYRHAGRRAEQRRRLSKADRAVGRD